MSGGDFAGILTPLTCRGSKGQSPLASLGTAQRLAPVHSGLPLCETCLSSAATIRTSIMFPSAAIYQNKKRLMTVVLWCVERLWRKTRLLFFAEKLDFQNRLFTRHSDAKYRTILCRSRHSVLFCYTFLHFLLYCF